MKSYIFNISRKLKANFVIPNTHKLFLMARRTNLLEKCPYSTIQDLPRLPVPPLAVTVQKYLSSVKPLLKDNEYIELSKILSDFCKPNNNGQKLQILLEEKASKSINWLEDWWINYAYLENRQPIAIHINPAIYMPPIKHTNPLRIATLLIKSILDYKVQIDNATIPVDKMGGSNLCMKQFYRILGCCRMPGANRDDVHVHVGGMHDSPKHIVVMCNNHIFSFDVYDDSGIEMSKEEIFAKLKRIVSLSNEKAPPIGLLTTLPRDQWFSAYQKLTSNENNYKFLTAISQSLFVLSLDEPDNNIVKDEETLYLNQFHHGNKINSANRWFDKVFQAIVSPNGRVGFNYEHSTAEGPPIIHLIDYCFYKMQNEAIEIDENKLDSYSNANLHHLVFENTSIVEEDIKLASLFFNKLIDDLELTYLKFDVFGKDLLKRCKVSPDSFIQIAFQLAYYSLHKDFVATYETGSLRKFMHGRTETIQSCTQESIDYCISMTTKNLDTFQKRELLIKAINKHRHQTDEVINGKGVHRHLLGLKLIGDEKQLTTSSLFDSPTYKKTINWKMSTSQVASKQGGLLGFAPVVPEGYGICYNPMESCLLFSISSWNHFPETNAKTFSSHLEQALMQGAELLQHPAKI